MTTATSERQPRYASHSSLSRHRTCPQQWAYGSVRKLTKVESEDPAVERDFGSWWHMIRAADSLERGRKLGSLKWTPSVLTSVDDGPTLDAATATPLLVHNLAVTWWSQQSMLTKAMWADRIGEDLPDRLWALFTAWREQWADEIAIERPLAVEMYWERTLPAVVQPAPEGADLGDDLPVTDPHTRLIGYIDELYFDTKRQIIVARDHKTSKRLGTQNVADDMMDSQLQLYAWGASPTVTSWGLGPLRATAYDRARMVKPATPLVTASGGLSKSVTDYDLSTYLTWCRDGVAWGEEGKFFVSGPRKDQPKFGRYEAEQKEIERLSSPAARSAWFQRTLTPLNLNLIKAHLRAAVDSAVDVGMTYERLQIEKAAARNLGSACRWCDFAGLCRAEMFGGPDGTYDLADFNLIKKVRSKR